MLREELLQLIDKYNLTPSDVASLTEYGIDSVRAWLVDTNSTKSREVPPRAMTILKLKLGINNQ